MDIKKTLAATVVATTLGVGGVALATAGGAGASGSTPTTTPGAGAAAKTGKHAGNKALRRRFIRDAAKIAAKQIGITPVQLRTELRTGKSVAQVATAHGVDPSKVVNAWVSAGNAKIDKAVANHRLTAERATKLKARLPIAADKLVNHVVKAK